SPLLRKRDRREDDDDEGEGSGGGRKFNLGRVVVEVNKVVTEMTEEKFKEVVENWIKSPDMRGLGGSAEGGLMLSGSLEI
ncbi:hypothetical protein LINGRAHAP2_LOCUS5042, partial [Linum grandiflorum]